MAYTILKTNGTVLARVADASINTTATSLTLVGRDYSGFGQYYNQNLVSLLSNSANVSTAPPANPIQGQLWYDTESKKIKVYDGSFASVSAAFITPNPPTVVGAGDFWYESTNELLNFMDPYGNWQTVGMYHRGQPTGWITPLVPVIDNTSVTQNAVTLLYNTDPSTAIGAVSHNSFTASTDSTSRYFTASGHANASIVAGLTLFGGANISGDVKIGGNLHTAPTTGTPGNTSTPASWLKVNVGGADYYMPLYQ